MKKISEVNKKNKKGFTLLELLVVVVMIAILAAIAVPQYNLAVEKTHMTEAITMLKAISVSQDNFYLIHNRYANAYEMDKLDIEIPGEINVSPTSLWHNRIKTKFFMFSPDGDNGTIDSPRSDGYKGVAHRLSSTGNRYYLYITKKNQLKCHLYSIANKAQEKLCNKINQDGHL